EDASVATRDAAIPAVAGTSAWESWIKNGASVGEERGALRSRALGGPLTRRETTGTGSCAGTAAEWSNSSPPRITPSQASPGGKRSSRISRRARYAFGRRAAGIVKRDL